MTLLAELCLPLGPYAPIAFVAILVMLFLALLYLLADEVWIIGKILDDIEDRRKRLNYRRR